MTMGKKAKQAKKTYQKPQLTQVKLAMKTSVLGGCYETGSGANEPTGCPTATCISVG